MFRKIGFENGLRVLFVPEKTTPSVTILVLVKTGSKYEKKEINGISHFLEHMCFKGTRKLPSCKEVAEVMDRVGGIYNAFTDQDYTGYFAKVDSSHFDLAFDWVSDIFLNSIFPKEEIEKEKKVILEEINMIHDNPMSQIDVLWFKLLYGDQPAGWNIAGERDTVMAMDRKKLMDYRKEHYLPENTLICLAGNFDQKRALKLAKKYFLRIEKKRPKGKEKVIERQKNPQCLLEERETDQTHIHLGVRAFNIFHPFRYAQQILAIVLGGMMSSRLFVEIREKLGLAYYINATAQENPDTGFLVASAGINNEKVDLAISTILKEFKKLTEKKVPNSELKKAKENLKGKLALLLEPSDARATFFGLQELLEGKVLTLKEIFKKIDSVNSNQIRKLAREIFRPEKLNLALIGPFKEKGKFEKILKI